jgi:hypothetical protein
MNVWMLSTDVPNSCRNGRKVFNAQPIDHDPQSEGRSGLFNESIFSAQIMDGVVLSDNAFNLNVAQTWVVPLKKMMMMRNGNRFYSGGDFYDR